MRSGRRATSTPCDLSARLTKNAFHQGSFALSVPNWRTNRPARKTHMSDDITTITRTEDLARFCEIAKTAPYVTVDTEFLRERTY